MVSISVINNLFCVVLATVTTGTNDTLTTPTTTLTSSKQEQTTLTTSNTTTDASLNANGTLASSTNGTVSQGNGIMKYLDNGVMYRMLYVVSCTVFKQNLLQRVFSVMSLDLAKSSYSIYSYKVLK